VAKTTPPTVIATSTTRAKRSDLVQFFAWGALGAAYIFGFLSVLSIGVLVLAVAGVGTALMLRRPAISFAVVTGLVAGSGLPVVFVAWMNRDGPGNICKTTSGGTSCAQEWNPLPFWLIAGLLLTGGAVAFSLLQRRAHSSASI
jgi:hypothetical protein